MIATIQFPHTSIRVDLSNPLDISLPVKKGHSVNAFYIPPVKIEPLKMGDFIGSVAEGGSCNVNNIIFNPHGNGTHTECVGHISETFYSINDTLKQFHFLAVLITVTPELQSNGDKIITLDAVKPLLKEVEHTSALIIRTRPNANEKREHQYSSTNPPYVDPALMTFINTKGFKHFLIDLPSVDKEDDGGLLSAHHSFWDYPHAIRMENTITELIFVPDDIEDGYYLLNLQISSFENDASPSKPVLYKIISA